MTIDISTEVEEIFVSIIVPVYNVERYLPACLDSLLFSQGKNLEVIAVDDCSLDSSAVILSKYKEKSSLLKVIRHPDNQGVSAARNSGIAAASGKYILFVDADDSLEDGAVERLKDAVTLSDADIVMFLHKCVNETGEVLSVSCESENVTYNLKDKTDQIRAFDSFIGSLMAWNGFFKRETIANLQFSSYPNGEDVLFGVQAFCLAGKIQKISLPLYNYLQRSESASKQKTKLHCLSTIDVCVEIFHAVNSLSYYDNIKRVFFRKLRAITHGTVLNVLLSLGIEERKKCWESWFKEFEKIYITNDLLPIIQMPIYRVVFKLKMPFLVKCIFKYPVNIKGFLLSNSIFYMVWKKARKCRYAII